MLSATAGRLAVVAADQGAALALWLTVVSRAG
jgi:hypothetical protein